MVEFRRPKQALADAAAEHETVMTRRSSARARWSKGSAMMRCSSVVAVTSSAQDWGIGDVEDGNPASSGIEIQRRSSVPVEKLMPLLSTTPARSSILCVTSSLPSLSFLLPAAAGIKIQRRSSVPTEKLMPPPSTTPSRSSTLHVTCSFPAHDGSGGGGGNACAPLQLHR
uniref:Uncharacterized protein n=1 Tax=Oryza nivara TaxID=4536 RepID=A0A0E0IBV6_ORYNI